MSMFIIFRPILLVLLLSLSGLAQSVVITGSVVNAEGVTLTQVPEITDLTITTGSPLPDGEVSVAYSETLSASGGTTPYSWDIVSGALPSGLSLNASTGEISGTPTSEGNFSFDAEVTDSASPVQTDVKTFSLTIDPESTGEPQNCLNQDCVISHNVGSGSDQQTFVGVASIGSDRDVSSVSSDLDGALSKVIDHDANGCTAEIWKLVSPTTGTHSITISFVGTTDVEASSGAVTLSNLQNVAAEATATDSEASSSTISTPITTSTDGAKLIAVLCGDANGNATPDTSTEFYDSAGPGPNMFGAGSRREVMTAGAVNFGWTASSSMSLTAVGAAFTPVVTALNFFEDAEDGDLTANPAWDTVGGCSVTSNGFAEGLNEVAKTTSSDCIPVTGVNESEVYFGFDLYRNGTGAPASERPYTLVGLDSTGHPEILNEGDFATHANWDVTGDFDDSGGAAVYTHSTGSGTLTQTAVNQASTPEGSTPYRITYDITSVSGDPTCEITTAFANSAVDLNENAGAQHIDEFSTTGSPGDFVISCTSTSGSITFDNLTLIKSPLFSLRVETDWDVFLRTPGQTANGGRGFFLGNWASDTSTYVEGHYLKGTGSDALLEYRLDGGIATQFTTGSADENVDRIIVRDENDGSQDFFFDRMEFKDDTWPGRGPLGGGGGLTGSEVTTDYGATCDGVADDSTEIQNAFNDCGSWTNNTLIFPSGTLCRVNAKLSLNSCSGFTIEGQGGGFKAADGLATDSGGALFGFSSNTNWTIKRLKIDGNRANRVVREDFHGHSMNIRGGSDGVLDEIEFINAPTDNLRIATTGSAEADLTNRVDCTDCIFRNAYRNNVSVIAGIDIRFLGTCTDFSFEGTCTCQSTGAIGTNPQAGIGWEPNGNEFSPAIDGGVIDGCLMADNNGAGVYSGEKSGAKNITIQNSIIRDNANRNLTPPTNHNIKSGAKGTLVDNVILHCNTGGCGGRFGLIYSIAGSSSERATSYQNMQIDGEVPVGTSSGDQHVIWFGNFGDGTDQFQNNTMTNIHTDASGDWCREGTAGGGGSTVQDNTVDAVTQSPNPGCP